MVNKVVNLPDNCIVRMDGALYESDDFVAILSKKDGDTSIFYSTDALTLGIAFKLVAKEFVKCVEQCSPSEQQEIEAILGNVNILERLRETNE